MLEQYKKDVLSVNDDRDLIQDNDGMGKRKLLFVVAGAAFALVFFLFLMGIFRSDEDVLAVRDLKSEMVTKESFLALEEKFSTLNARLEKIEKEKSAAPIASVGQSSSQERLENTSQMAQAPLHTPEEATLMMNDSIRQFITKSALDATPEPIAAVESKKTVATKETKGNKAKATAKTTSKAATKSNPGTHIVQKGDTLSKISQRYYGTTNRWKNIYDANKGRIANINNLKVGTEIIIPEAKQ